MLGFEPGSLDERSYQLIMSYQKSKVLEQRMYLENTDTLKNVCVLAFSSFVDI